MSQKKLPAGKYYIGDPCYVIDDEVWGEFLDPFWSSRPAGVFDFDGHTCACFNTAWGDGQYKLEPIGDWLPVDAGIIGAIPAVLCTRGGAHDGAMVEFDEPFTCQAVNGKLYFGEYSVETNEDYDDDEDDCCPECGR